MNGDQIVALIGVIAALVLAWRGIRSYNVPHQRMIGMAMIWLAVIAGLAVLFHLTGALPASWRLTYINT